MTHPGAEFCMQCKPYEGKRRYLKYMQVVRNACQRVVITNDRLYIQALPEQDWPRPHKQAKVCWTVEGLRSNAYLRDLGTEVITLIWRQHKSSLVGFPCTPLTT